jgi:hypothetical protein
MELRSITREIALCNLESQLVDKLFNKIIRELERAGRDKAKCRSGLRWLLFGLEMSVGPDPEWAEEYRGWLLTSWAIALERAKVRAVGLEEYEWAAEITVLLDDLAVEEEIE